MRPEYMVHEAYKPDPSNTYDRPARGPVAFDKLSVFERDGGNRATDKTVKLPELKKHGKRLVLIIPQRLVLIIPPETGFNTTRDWFKYHLRLVLIIPPETGFNTTRDWF